ncbi:MAG: YfhO family protein [Chloroflexota bacterium]
MERLLEGRRWLLPALLAALTLILLRPALLPLTPGDVPSGKDLVNMFYPLNQATGQMIRAGDLPLWNPHQFIGHPLAGNPHAALLYPGTWFVWLADTQRGMALMLALHTWLGAWGMARVARAFGSSQSGALLAGVIYAMSGWAGARYYAGHYNLMLVAGWVPWGIVAYRFALARRTPVALLPGIGVLGAALLAGYPPLLIQLAWAWVALWGYHVATTPDGERRRVAWGATWRAVAIALGALILGAGLVLPAAELGRLSVREGAGLDFANLYALPSANLLTLLAPGLFGSPQTGPYFYWGADFVEEYTAYAGLLPLLAIPLAFRWARRENAYFLALVAFGVVYAVGIEGAIMPVVVQWVPGAASFRVPARALLLVVIGLAGLTALLITHLQRQPLDARAALLRPALRVWLPGAIALLFALAIVFSGWYAAASHVEPMPLRAYQVAGALALAGVFALGAWIALWLWRQPEVTAGRWALALTAAFVILDAWHGALPLIQVGPAPEAPIWTGARSNVPLDGAGRVLERLPWGGPLNGASVTGHLHVLGYDPLVIASFDKLQQLGDADDPNSRLNTLLGVRYVLATGPLDDAANFKLIGIAYDSFYYERADPFPRAWIATEAIIEPDDDAALALLAGPATDLRATVTLDRALDCPSGGGEAEIVSYEASAVQIKTSGAGGVLVLSDQYYPGWQAAVDGQPVEIARADTALRAVCVPPGEHSVTFSYRPLSFYAGTAISAAGWALWALASVIALRRWRRGTLTAAAPSL